jgi:hypothetical protein
MDLNAQLAVAKQSFDELVALCELDKIADWRPTPEQRQRYVALADSALSGLDRLRLEEQRRLFAEGRIRSFVPESLLAAVRGAIEPRESALRAAMDLLDPEGKAGRDALAAFLKLRGGDVRATFEQGLDQVEDLIERNPDLDFPFVPSLARDALDSKLIQFNPDAWLDRAAELTPIRTHKVNFEFPSHIRFRLEELYRVYVFGCWLSVFGLSRAILEYAILDNLNKFGIEAEWPPDRDGTRKPRKLSHLIDDVAAHLPRQAEAMARLRDWGNEYLHPRTSRMSKEALFERQKAAKSALEMLVDVLEAIYLAPRQW